MCLFKKIKTFEFQNFEVSRFSKFQNFRVVREKQRFCVFLWFSKDFPRLCNPNPPQKKFPDYSKHVGTAERSRRSNLSRIISNLLHITTKHCFWMKKTISVHSSVLRVLVERPGTWIMRKVLEGKSWESNFQNFSHLVFLSARGACFLKFCCKDWSLSHRGRRP